METMATYGWGTDSSIEEWLFAEGYRFDFYQAVKMLEKLYRTLHPDAKPIGEDAEPDKEAVRFRSQVSLTFPATDVAEIIPPLLFRLEGEFRLALNRNVLPEELRSAFEYRKIPLSQNVTILPERDGLWRIIDKDNHDLTHFVEQRGNQLNVYTPPLLFRFEGEFQSDFSIALVFQSQLDNDRNISEDLRQEFEKNGLSLSPNATISIQQRGSRWLITDTEGQQTYLIRKEKGELNIYNCSVLPEKLRQAFAEHQMPLSQNVTILPESDNLWRLIDRDNLELAYVVEQWGNQLNVYILPGRDEKPAEMTVNFMGLAGGMGPLPMPDTELIIERVWNKDTAFRDFLDIFNHRLVSLMYRVRKMHRVGLELKAPDQSHVADYLFSLIGLGTEGLRGRMQVNDRALLLYTGLLAQQPRSAIGLELLLSDYFKVKVKVRQLCGAWYPLAEDQWTFIGPTGQNQYLGEGTVLGTHVWDQQGKLELHLGPLTLEEFLDLLPGERGFRSLCELTQFYVGDEFDFEIQLTLKAAEVPESRLSAVSGPKLGWTSWLKTREFEADDSRVKLTTRSSL